MVRIEDIYTGKATLSKTVTCELSTLKLQPGKIARVMAIHIKPVFRLTTALGRTVEATANHPFYTFDGWRFLESVFQMGKGRDKDHTRPAGGREAIHGQRTK